MDSKKIVQIIAAATPLLVAFGVAEGLDAAQIEGFTEELETAIKMVGGLITAGVALYTDFRKKHGA